MQLAAFPDTRMEVQDIVASGDKVVARVRYPGTNRGEFMGAPATGKSVDVQLIDISRFGDDGPARAGHRPLAGNGKGQARRAGRGNSLRPIARRPERCGTRARRSCSTTETPHAQAECRA